MGAEQFRMEGQQGLAVRPADIGIFALRDGTDPSLGTAETICDSDLCFARRQNLVNDGFPVHGGDYQDSISLSQQHPVRLFKHNPDMDTLSARLKHAREQKGWSQPELARQSGVKQSFIGALEAENQKTSGWLPELAHALGVDAYWLKTGKGPIRPGESPAADVQRQTCPEDPEAVELAALIKRIPEAERKAMLTMLRARFGVEDRRAQRETAKNAALAGFADVTQKPRDTPKEKHK